MMGLIRIHVCTECLSPAILYKDCRCVWDKHYPTVELEFEQCECCGHVAEQPAETAFNDIQLGELEPDEPEED